VNCCGTLWISRSRRVVVAKKMCRRFFGGTRFTVERVCREVSEDVHNRVLNVHTVTTPWKHSTRALFIIGLYDGHISEGKGSGPMITVARPNQGALLSSVSSRATAAAPETQGSEAPQRQDSVTLSPEALAYVDPDEMGKSMREVGRVVGGVGGSAVDAAAAFGTGQPEAALLTVPAGLAAGSAMGMGGGYAAGVVTARALNTAETVVRGTGRAINAGVNGVYNAVTGAYSWATGQ